MVLNNVVVKKNNNNKYQLIVKDNKSAEIIAYIALPQTNDDLKNIQALDKICAIIGKEWGVYNGKKGRK